MLAGAQGRQDSLMHFGGKTYISDKFSYSPIIGALDYTSGAIYYIYQVSNVNGQVTAVSAGSTTEVAFNIYSLLRNYILIIDPT